MSVSCLTENVDAQKQRPSIKRRTCKVCEAALASAPDVNGEMLEWVCANKKCERNGWVVARSPIHQEHVERFGRTPTNEGVFGKNLGGTVPKQMLHMIAQQNKDVVSRDKFILEKGNKFRMDTREGRKALSREKCRLQQLVQPHEDPNIHYALELLSRHNRAGMRLSEERYAMLCQFMRPIVSAERYLELYPEGRLPPSVIRDILDGVLEDVLGLPPIKFSLKVI